MKTYTKLRFGTAGIPLSTPEPTTLTGIEQVRKLNLDAMELEFVHSVNISKEKAPLVKEIAQKNDVALTCHGQYYINLNAVEPEKIQASIGRVLNAATIANACGARSVTFHAGFYLKDTPEKTYESIKNNLKIIIKRLQEDNNSIMVRPETTGKGTQYGTIPEILKLSQEVEQIMPCIDFSHLHARSNGKWNSKPEFQEVFRQVESALGKEGLQNMHCHISGINYGEKGEKNHLILKESDMNYSELMQTFKEFNAKGIIICESPNIEDDAKLLQDIYGKRPL